MAENRTIASLGSSLSFAFSRPADNDEVRRLEGMARLFAVNPKRDLADLGWALLQGLGIGVFVVPLLFILVLVFDASGLTHLNNLSLWPRIFAGWAGITIGMGAWRIIRRRACERHIRLALERDIASGEVVEEAWRFVECIAFQEAETYPFLYAMRADSGAVIMLDEVALRGTVEGAGQAAKSAAPADAVLVRGACSGALVSENYSGPTLPILELYRLTTAAEKRPAHGALLKGQWADVPNMFSARAERLF